MSESKTDPRKSGQVLHDQYVAWVANLFVDSGWKISYDPVAVTPSGSPVRADLRADDPLGQQYLFEFKMGNSQDYLPMSAYAQGAQLNRSGIPAILVTNMKVPEHLAELFRGSQIAVVTAPPNFDQKTFLDNLRTATQINPAVLARGRKQF